MNSLISSFATLFLFSVSLPTQYIHMRLHPIGSAIWSDIVRDIRGLHTVHNTLIDDDFYDSSWLSWLHLLIWVFCVFLWWFCSLGTRLGILLTLRACFVSLKSFSSLSILLWYIFDQYKKSKRTFFSIVPTYDRHIKAKNDSHNVPQFKQNE